MHICDTLRDLVPFVQFKKCENTHGGMLLLVTATLLNVTLLHGSWVFFTFFKLYKWYQIEQRITIKNQDILSFFLRYRKDIGKLSGYFEHVLPNP